MSTHTLRKTLAAAVAGALTAGALAGPALAATDGSGDASLITVRKAGGQQQYLTAGQPTGGSIIGVL